MKKLVGLLLIIAFSFCSIGPAYTEITRKDGMLVRALNSDETLVYDLLQIAQVNTLEKYALWVSRHIKYSVNVPNNVWHSCKQILNKGTGDCKDFATVHYTALGLFGFKPKILGLFAKDWGHAICYFKKDEFYWFFTNEQLKETKADTIEAFYLELQNLFKYKRIYEIDAGDKRLIRLTWGEKQWV